MPGPLSGAIFIHNAFRLRSLEIAVGHQVLGNAR
jgi:hypothetical protein